ncbi:AAA family ATPase [Bradyrhizobium sp. 153]|uniref:AAA family ATPase n=1 Tax=Bradyrhizobium sp. 153 TaxID=2782627 RepID=UPI001FF85420|nr:AAA family ATPase [Bradyrhizobium sp. 153]MCK1666490.1 AAA family ATPase [Bradyrhizobium sp. 153]
MAELFPAYAPIPIIVARNAAAAIAAIQERPALALLPVHTDWNDFSYHFGATLLVMTSAKDGTSIDIRLMFEGKRRTEDAITELLGQRAWAPLAEANLPYCSVLDSLDLYREIVRLLGFERAVTALRTLGDAAVLRFERVDLARVALLESETFSYGALRAESTYVAYRRGIKYLRPQPVIDVEDAAASFIVTAHLPSAENPYIVDFDFDPDALSRNRITVLIGRNGTGKTQLLLGFIAAMRAGHDVDPQSPPVGISPPASFNRIFVFSSVASDVYPRSIPPWLGVDYQYFSMILSPPGEENALTSAITDCLRDDGKIAFTPSDGSMFARTGRMALLDQALDSLGFAPSVYLPLKSSNGPYDLFTHQRGDRLYFRLADAKNLNEKRRILLAQAIDPQQQPVLFGIGPGVRELSSGELAMLRFAAQAAGSAERGCLFLFDEPETHLHPNFVSEFMAILNTVVTATQSVGIIVTHSAYVVREVPSQRVRIFSLEDRKIAVDKPRLQTFGASIDSISQFVFADTSISHQYQETLQAWFESLGPGISIEAIIEQFGNQMNSETLSYVARLIRNRS